MAEITVGYWLLTEDQIKSDLILITPPEDVLPIAYFKVFNEVSVFVFDDIKYHIIHSVISNDVMDQFIKEFGDNPFLPECTDQINISSIWLGSTKKEMVAKILERFNIDLLGEREIGTEPDGTPIMAPYLIESTMAGQESEVEIVEPEVSIDNTESIVLEDTFIETLDSIVVENSNETEEPIDIPIDPVTDFIEELPVEDLPPVEEEPPVEDLPIEEPPEVEE